MAAKWWMYEPWAGRFSREDEISALLPPTHPEAQPERGPAASPAKAVSLFDLLRERLGIQPAPAPAGVNLLDLAREKLATQAAALLHLASPACVPQPSAALAEMPLQTPLLA